jgi:hypothetical protein
LRPWLQDFDYGKDYTEKDVLGQVRGTYESGLTSWMVWDPSNKYTPSAYESSAIRAPGNPAVSPPLSE